MKYIKINENGIHIVFEITDKNQIKLLHFSKVEFDENDICKFGNECKAEDLARKEQFINEAFQLVQVNLAGYNRPYEKHGNKHICTAPLPELCDDSSKCCGRSYSGTGGSLVISDASGYQICGTVLAT